MKTFWILGQEIELNSDGLKKVMDIIDNAGHNDAKQIGHSLLGELIKNLPKKEKPQLTEMVPAESPASTLGHFNSYAYLREDLVENGHMPSLLNYNTGEESFLDPRLAITKFPCLQPDKMDDDEYNLIIVYPNGKWYKAISSDFEFMDIPVKSTFNVNVLRVGYGSRSIEVTARTQVEANQLALDKAGSYEFNEYGSDHSVSDVLCNRQRTGIN